MCFMSKLLNSLSGILDKIVLGGFALTEAQETKIAALAAISTNFFCKKIPPSHSELRLRRVYHAERSKVNLDRKKAPCQVELRTRPLVQ